MMGSWKIFFGGVLCCFGLFSSPSDAAEQLPSKVDCTVFSQGFNFGSVDAFMTSHLTLGATVEVNCTGMPNEKLKICTTRAFSQYPDQFPFLVTVRPSFDRYDTVFDHEGKIKMIFDIQGEIALPNQETGVIPREYSSNLPFFIGVFPGQENEYCHLSYAPRNVLYNLNIPLSVKVSPQCWVKATDIHFGSHTHFIDHKYAQGEVSAKCTQKTPYSITLTSASGMDLQQLHMRTSQGEHALQYGLYGDHARTRAWEVNRARGTGAWQSFPVYGVVDPQNMPPAGIYRDQVIVTLTF